MKTPSRPETGTSQKTSTALAVKRTGAVGDLALTESRLHDTLGDALSTATKAAYSSSWVTFTDWCSANHKASLPAAPKDVALFLQAEADRSMSLATLQSRIAAIAYMHKLQDENAAPPTRAPIVARLMAGLRRRLGPDQDRKRALRVEELRRILPKLSVRDRAIMLFGFATGMRRAELAALTVGDLSFEPRGVVVRIPRSKTDQEGRGQTIGVVYGQHAETCPVKALEAWLEARWRAPARPAGWLDHDTAAKPVFGIGAKTIARVVKAAVSSIGLDPEFYAGHSLRAGLVTEADERGVDRVRTRKQTRHKSDKMLDRYSRTEDVLANNVTKDLGL